MSARNLFSLSFGAFLLAGCADTAANRDNAARNPASTSGAATDRSSTTSTDQPLANSRDGSVDRADARQYDATNTGRNRRDRDGNNLTADDQSESRGDLQTAAEIRRAITKDDSLSVNAHNVKIIAREGAVTLRGPVDSEEERQTILDDAKRIAGGAKLVDELEVKKTGTTRR